MCVCVCVCNMLQNQPTPTTTIQDLITKSKNELGLARYEKAAGNAGGYTNLKHTRSAYLSDSRI